MNSLDYIIMKYAVNCMLVSPIQLDISREVEFPVLLQELGFRVGVEIGVEQGKFSETLCKANPNLKLYSIDPWEAYMRGSHVVPQDKLNRYFAEALERLKPYNCEIIRRYSLDMVRKFKPNTLDFVYIDGNHEFEYVMQDIIEWAKRVRPGGMVAGHDYYHFRLAGVVEAVNAYTDAHGIKEWFVTGEKEASWFWVKR